MKFISNISKIIPILFMSIALVSCSDDDNVTPVPATPNIVELAQDTPELSTLVAAILAADGDLATVLSGGSFTVLAPTNTAFNNFLADNGFASLDDVPTAVLSQILLNHVITGEVSSTDLTTAGAGYSSTNADGPGGNKLSIYFNTTSGVSFNGVSDVSTADVEASNGIVHIVDAVIGLPTIVDFALADPNFSTLVAALTRSDLTTDYVGILSTPNGTAPAPFTVFAPINEAFGDLLTELSLMSLDDIDEPTLNATLSYHAVAGANVRSSDLTQGMMITTLGGDITASLDSGPQLIDGNDRVSNIIVVDVQAANGVIHAIDKVVLPELE
jgi:uncharacterized surface protein with fasciclin (FAS1) repeats